MSDPKPASIDAERRLIGCLIRDSLPLPDGLNPSDFYEPRHQDLASVIRSLADEGNPADELTATMRLRERGSVIEAWEVSSIVSEAGFSPINPAWANAITRHAALRRLASVAERLAALSADPAADPNALVAYAEGSIKAATVTKPDANGPTPFLFKDLVAFDKENDPTCVLGNRFLCRGGSCMIVSQTGAGKSALLTHAAINLALGSDFFGIRSRKGPLTSVIVQSENDGGDCAEGIIGCLDSLAIPLGSQTVDLLSDRVFFYREAVRTGEDFGQLLRDLITRHKADIIWVDPLLGFAGVDLSDQQAASHFLRHIIQPVLQDTGVILFSVHHTTKPSKDKQGGGSLLDLAYSGAGSAELANWHRSVITLTKDPTPDGEDEQPFFTMKVVKRGGRSGIKDERGNYTVSVPLRHSKTPGRIAWERRNTLTVSAPPRQSSGNWSSSPFDEV
jgi:hypothetical protein